MKWLIKLAVLRNVFALIVEVCFKRGQTINKWIAAKLHPILTSTLSDSNNSNEA